MGATVQTIDISPYTGNTTIGDDDTKKDEVRSIEAAVQKALNGVDGAFKLQLGDKTVTYANIKQFQDALKSGDGKLDFVKAAAAERAQSNDPKEALVAQMDSIKAEIQKTKDAEQVATLKNQLSELIAKARNEGILKNEQLATYETAAAKSTDAKSDSAKAETRGFKASVTSNSTSNSGSSGSTGGASGGAKAQSTQSGTTSNYPPAGWKADTTGSSAAFSADSYMQSVTTTDNIMSSWDDISKNQSKGKQLMQLFYYFSKMAESGDMGAMYQFMKFITYIVSKDKAKQQIEMGKKLIEMQELSRQWTN